MTRARGVRRVGGTPRFGASSPSGRPRGGARRSTSSSWRCSPGCGGWPPTRTAVRSRATAPLALTWYIATSEAATVSLNISLINDIGTDIGSGAVAVELLRPASVLGVRVAAEVGRALPRLAVLSVAGAVLAAVVVGRTAELAGARPGRAEPRAGHHPQHRRPARLRGVRLLAAQRRIGLVPLPEARVRARRHAHPARGAARLAAVGDRGAAVPRDGVRPRPTGVRTRGARGSSPSRSVGSSCWPSAPRRCSAPESAGSRWSADERARRHDAQRRSPRRWPTGGRCSRRWP